MSHAEVYIEVKRLMNAYWGTLNEKEFLARMMDFDVTRAFLHSTVRIETTRKP